MTLRKKAQKEKLDKLHVVKKNPPTNLCWSKHRVSKQSDLWNGIKYFANNIWNEELISRMYKKNPTTQKQQSQVPDLKMAKHLDRQLKRYKRSISTWKDACPGWGAKLFRGLSCAPKPCRLNLWSQHIPRSEAQSPVRALTESNVSAVLSYMGFYSLTFYFSPQISRTHLSILLWK